ncbi:MAG: secretin and TonB N-terminal domain-containing protein, partial [Rhodanobacteraceae bacterium]
MFKLFARGFLMLACALPTWALAQQQTAETDIPAGNLVTALDALARQTGVQFVYSADQLAGLTTRGAHGNLSAQQALTDLLAGTGYHARHDDSGAVVIVKDAPRPSAPPASGPAQGAAPPKTLQEVVVTGSRIPRSQIEGPAPVVAITAQDIQ